MKYSYNLDKKDVVFAQLNDINASFKDLAAVCDAIRYKSITSALEILDETIIDEKPILYRTYNKYMGSRHELGGRKGRTPMKCAAIVRKVIVNAAANATNKGFNPDTMYIVHAAANKTVIARRGPPKGALFTLQGIYGYQPSRHMDLEFAKVEIGLSELDEKKLSADMTMHIKRSVKRAAIKAKARAKIESKFVKVQPTKKSIISKVHPEQMPKGLEKPKPEAKKEETKKPEVKEKNETKKEEKNEVIAEANK